MKTDIILVFDIGKTNKKVVLFNKDLKIISEKEQKFEEIIDDDGFACENIAKLEEWILETCEDILKDDAYCVKGINFTTYGATMMYTDEAGLRLTPLYNYLKPMPEGIADPLYNECGGLEEFSRKTASPALGMLNSGLNILWLKKEKEHVFEKVRHIMHFPQYLSSLLTGKITSEHTSIGCHTALWDFDKMKYHDWLEREGIQLPDPIPVETTFPAKKIHSDVPVGIGMHDSSASLAPYFNHSQKPFILISTGTWCINMNPFNHSPLTTEQLNHDCLSYMSIGQKPVKSSRFFLGHIHDVNVEHLSEHFQVPCDTNKTIIPDKSLLHSLMNNGRNAEVYFSEGLPSGFVDRKIKLSRFNNFIEVYHRLMIDLVNLTAESIDLIIDENDSTEDLYITGGFARNPLFVSLMATRFCNQKVYTSELPNSTSMGGALAIWETLDIDKEPSLKLGLKRIDPFEELLKVINQTPAP